jgi:outer membrane cobalamin receptor
VRSALLPLISFVAVSPLVAQPPVVEADPVVVTLSALPFPFSIAPGSITIIDRESIEASRATTLDDVLRSSPFVDLSRTGGRGGLTTVTLRGGDPNFTLVLLDGVPINDPTNLLGGSFDFSTLSVDNVERVEIVRGPLSSRFGSEAMAGVVHIVSRRGRTGAGWNAEVGAGSFAARDVRLGGRGSRGALAASASASWVSMDEQVERDPYRLATLALTADAAGRLGEVRVVSRLQDVDSEGFPDNGGGPRFSILREPRRTAGREVILGVEARRRIRGRWSVTAAADAYRRDADVRTPAILDADPPGPFALPAVDQETAFDRRRLSLATTWEIVEGLSILASGELRLEDGESDAVIAGAVPADFALERTTRSAAAEIAWRASRLSIDLALRIDGPEDFSSEVSPRAAFAWRPWEGSRVAASWGEGFKLPSFFALGEPNVGNPDLGPERSRGFDVGWMQESPAGGLVVSLTAFRQRYRDLIDFSPEEFRLVNRRLARTKGVEAEVDWRPHRHVALTGFARWLEAELVGTDEELRDRPRWRGGASAEWSDGATQARIELVWVGERFDFQIPVPERDVVDEYSTASLALSRRFGRVTAFTRVDNLLDADYEDFVGFPAPGRSARVGVRVTGGS